MVAAEGQHTYRYPRPGLTVDACIVAEQKESNPRVLLIQRKHEPFAGAWALPGGFVDEGEPLNVAAARELQEETSVDPSTIAIEQVGAYGDPGRDPRGWTVTVAYCAIVPSTDLGVKVLFPLSPTAGREQRCHHLTSPERGRIAVCRSSAACQCTATLSPSISVAEVELSLIHI